MTNPNKWKGANRLQVAPKGDWYLWSLFGGRGSGKTRALSEWVNIKARGPEPVRIALVGRTFTELRYTLLEGESGILNVAGTDVMYTPSSRKLKFPNGSVVSFFSSEEPDSIRGHQFNYAVCDDVNGWRGSRAWDNLFYATRLGDTPQVAAASTPTNSPVLESILAQKVRTPERVIFNHLTTYDNASNLSDLFIENLVRTYGDTEIANQTIWGQLPPLTTKRLT